MKMIINLNDFALNKQAILVDNDTIVGTEQFTITDKEALIAAVQKHNITHIELLGNKFFVKGLASQLKRHIAAQGDYALKNVDITFKEVHSNGKIFN